MMPKLYKNPLNGPCAKAANAKCKNEHGMEVCVVSPYGADQDTIDSLHETAADLMWGGKGHDIAHVVIAHGGKKYCMQVESKKIANDAKWRDHGDAWAKKHGTKIEDGKCGSWFDDKVKSWDHKGTSVSIWMH